MRRVGADGADALSDFIAYAFPDGAPDPVVVEYRYGDFVFRQGIPCWPGNGPPPSNYVSNGLALGLILDNECEVQLRDIPLPGDSRRARPPEALLGPGQWLGLFELFDRVREIDPVSSPDWNISAGSQAIVSLAPNLHSAAIAKALKKSFGVTGGRDPVSLFAFLQPIIHAKGLETDWRARVLYIPVAVLERFLELLREKAPDPRVLFLYRALMDRAWTNLRRSSEDARKEIRNGFLTAADRARELNDRVRRGLLSDDKGYPAFVDSEVLLAAARIGALLYKACTRMALVYGPSCADERAGPFSAISAVLEKCTLPRGVMRPFYMRRGDVGYYRLEDTSPLFFSEKWLERTDQVGVALQALTEENFDWDARKRIREIYETVRFRLPTANAEFVTLKPRTVRPRGLELDETGFFNGAFAGEIVTPSPRARFFKTSFRFLAC